MCYPDSLDSKFVVTCTPQTSALALMLSRTADSLFWLARYVERADNTARIIDAANRLATMPIAYAGTSNEWESALSAASALRAFEQHYPEASRDAVIEFLAFSPANPSSIKNCLEIARNNSRAVRTALTAEMWEAINGAWLELKRFDGTRMDRPTLNDFLSRVKEACLRFDGAAYKTMLRNDAYYFLSLGFYLERADNTARILDVKYHVLLPEPANVGGGLDYFQWASILRSVSALTAYRWVYHESLKPWLIADLARAQRADAALAGELLRQPHGFPRRALAGLRPTGPCPDGPPAPSAPACRTRGSPTSSRRRVCTNS